MLGSAGLESKQLRIVKEHPVVQSPPLQILKRGCCGHYRPTLDHMHGVTSRERLGEFQPAAARIIEANVVLPAAVAFRREFERQAQTLRLRPAVEQLPLMTGDIPLANAFIRTIPA